MRPARATLGFLMLLLVMLAAPGSQAQMTAGISTLMDPSVRFSGMGRTGTAVFWGADLNDWANPALLAYNDGLRFESSKTQLVPDLASDVFFRTNRIVWAGWGVGIAAAGRPIDALGGDKIDYGETVLTNENGDVIGHSHQAEDDNTAAVGISALRSIRSGSEFLGLRLPAVDRFADISGGYAWKHVKYEESGTAPVFGNAEVDEKDRGYVVRLTPYDAIGYPGLLPDLESVVRLKIEGSYGASEINSKAAPVNFPSGTLFGPRTEDVPEDHRRAIAFHAALGLPASLESSLRQSGRGWVYDLVTPILSYGRTSEHSIFYSNGQSAGDEVRRSGWEITVANVFSYRKGHHEDPNADVIGDTSGWGLGFHIRGVAGIQYDHATIPQSAYLGRVRRNGFSVYLNPIWAVHRVRQL